MTETVPVVLVDSREQVPLNISTFPVQVMGLPVGDYGIAGFSDWTNPGFVVERRSLPDLVASLTQGRDRFMGEVGKMRQFRFHALVIEALEAEVELGKYRSSTKPQGLYGNSCAES